MCPEKLAIKRNWLGLARCSKAIVGDVQAVAIGIGWLALLALLSHGGVCLVQAFGSVPIDVDLPQPGPDYDQVMMADSIIVMGFCAVVVVIAELLRRRQRGALANDPPTS